MNKILDAIAQADSIAILGHVRPDGDCVGSCLGLYNYIVENYANKIVKVYLQTFRAEFNFLNGAEQVRHNYCANESYDLCCVLDCGDIERTGEFMPYYQTAKMTVCVDHHISNNGFGMIQDVDITACSTSEAIYDIIGEKKLSKSIAECLYLGIIHDTGVFKHSNTTCKTMHIAGKLIEYGAKPYEIIDDTFYRKTYVQNKLLGQALIDSYRILSDTCIISYISKQTFELYNATSLDTDGIIDQLRITDGIECAILIYELLNQEYKVSMRSNQYLDVSLVAAQFGGGGHIRAAGFSVTGKLDDIIQSITIAIKQQLAKLEDAN